MSMKNLFHFKGKLHKKPRQELEHEFSKLTSRLGQTQYEINVYKVMIADLEKKAAEITIEMKKIGFAASKLPPTELGSNPEQDETPKEPA